MATFQIQKSQKDPIPWVLYPSKDGTVWIVTTTFGNPSYSQIINFTLGAGPRLVLNLTNVSLNSIAVDRLGRVWFPNNVTLSSYDPLTKKLDNDTSFPSNPAYIAIDAANRVWLTLVNSNQIAMYDPSSKQTKTYTVPTANAILQGITVAPDGMVWFVEALTKKLGRLDPTTGNITEYSSPLELVAPVQAAVAPSGVVWFTDHGTNEFGSFNPATGQWQKFPTGYFNGYFVTLPNAIAVDDQGKIWFSEHIAGRIARYDPIFNVLTEYIIPGQSSNTLAYAWWAALGPNNLVWFTAFGLGEIGYVNASVPVPLFIAVESQLTVPEGWSKTIPVAVSYAGLQTVSLGVSVSSRDRAGGVPLITGSYLPEMRLGSSPIIPRLTISAGWGVALGEHFVTVTASDGQVTVSIPVRLTIVGDPLPYPTLGLDVGISLMGLVLYFQYQRKRPRIPRSKLQLRS